jgi:hypothetical protein
MVYHNNSREAISAMFNVSFIAKSLFIAGLKYEMKFDYLGRNDGNRYRNWWDAIISTYVRTNLSF